MHDRKTSFVHSESDPDSNVSIGSKLRIDLLFFRRNHFDANGLQSSGQPDLLIPAPIKHRRDLTLQNGAKSIVVCRCRYFLHQVAGHGVPDRR